MRVESTHHIQSNESLKLQTVAIHQTGKFQGPALPQRNIPKVTVWLTFGFQKTSNKISQMKGESSWFVRSEPK